MVFLFLFDQGLFKSVEILQLKILRNLAWEAVHQVVLELFMHIPSQVLLHFLLVLFLFLTWGNRHLLLIVKVIVEHANELPLAFGECL